MRLLQKINLYYVFLSSVIFVIAGIVLYLSLKAIIANELNEKLLSNHEEVAMQIKNGEQYIKFAPYVEVLLLENPVSSSIQIKDTLIMDPVEKEPEPFRQLVSNEKINEQYYRIIIRSSTIESKDYLTAIAVVAGIVLLLLLLGILYVNFFVSKKIWAEFRTNLNRLSQFSIKEDPDLLLQPSSIEEFREMNRVVEQMAEQAKKDYRLLKEFTENASHELQTPMAVLRSNIELLIQNPKLDKEQAGILEKINSAVQRMTSLNKGLLLLAKIDNGQFTNDEPLNISQLLRSQLDYFSSRIAIKELELSTNIEDQLIIPGNRELAEILLTNLLDNAIRHNHAGGRMQVDLTASVLVIKNTGSTPESDPMELFRRFKKGKGSLQSVGLGLAIVQQICTFSGWKVTYSYHEPIHSLEVDFGFKIP